MSENIENKKIAKLSFDVNTQNLDAINEKLKEIAKTSKSYTNDISKNLSTALNSGKLIDNNSIEKSLNNIKNKENEVVKYTNSQIQRIGVSYNKEMQKRETDNQKALNKIKVNENNLSTHIKRNDDDVATYHEKLELKKQYATEKSNAAQLKSTKTLSDKITEYAKTYIIYQGFNQLRNVITEVIDEMVELEYQMVQIDRVLNENELNIDKYRDKLIQLAYDYGNSFENVADVTLRLAQAGFDSNESLALTEKTLLALNTAELDATEATADMVAVMAQWGLMTGDAKKEAKDYGDIIDKINKVADRYPTTSADILEALKKTSSAFNLAGASIDETIATIVAAETASQRGGKAIGTALSNIIQQLKESKRIDIAESLGLDFYTDETKTQFKDIMDIFTEMSVKMQALKDAGKENSVEMQNLLSIFTVFRRNIGASLLGEMSGEDSTYLKVLNDSLTATGYSLEENAKHMQTAKAAQAQFNSELLKLKTEVWDSGVEEVYRNLLNFGTDFVNGIQTIIKEVGLLPTAIGTVTLAFTALNKNFQGFKYNSETGGIQLEGFFKKIANGTAEVRKAHKTFVEFKNGQMALSDVVGKSGKTWINNSKEVLKYSSSLVTATIKTIALQAATIALNVAISAGISLAITALVKVIDDWIHADEKAIEKSKELIDTAQDNVDKINEEAKSIQDLRKEYEELAKKDNRTSEENQRIYEIQTELNKLIEETGTQVDLVTEKTNEQGKAILEINKNYDEQLAKIKAIEYEKKKQEVLQLKTIADETKNMIQGANLNEDKTFWEALWKEPAEKIVENLKETGFNIEKYFKEELGEENIVLSGDYFDFSAFNTQFSKMDINKQVKALNEWKRVLTEASKDGKDYSKSISVIDNALKKVQEQINNVKEATDKYNDALAELYAMSGQVDTYSTLLQSISDSYDIEGPKKLITDLQDINKQFSDGTINIEDYFNKIQEKISEIDLSVEGEELEAYQAIFATTIESLADGISSLNAGLESGSINFSNYSTGIKEASENMLDLYINQNNLSYDEIAGVWKDAEGNINEYANALSNAIDKLSGMGDILTTIGDNYDYIAEHADEAGNAAFKMADIGSAEYTRLANSMAESLNKMKATNNEAYNAIVDKVYESMGSTANETANADAYITNALNSNAQALNAALNEAANQVSISTRNVTVSMGNVLSKLGEAISGFNYKITATPHITGSFGLSTDANGIPNGIKLPSFGFDITGSGGASVQGLGSALQEFGSNLSSLGENQFKYTSIKSSLEPYQPTGRPSSSYTPSNPSGSKGSGGSSRDTTDKAAEEAARAEEDAYKQRLAQFKEYINEKERLEKRWVDKQKELGLLSNEDYLFITEQRIKRYQEYLDAVKKATWMKAEDRLALEKEYSEKIEDLQLDYLGYLKDELDDQIKALQDANKEKIALIEEEADKKIEALKKVENENDRIRAKEEYLKKRQEHLDDISYWEQRTGREAQEALKEAKENLQELDEEWNQQLEDWSIEDQIKAIEEQRDEQIKAIQDAEAAEIKSLQDIYDAKVKLFAETGQIIYENSVLQSQNLYNAYKKNFIDPILSDLQELNKVQAPSPVSTPSPTPVKQYETYTIKYGDTLSGIASKFGTTVDKIMSANPYVTDKNKIYSGKTLQIPKFHEGGIVGGNKEGFALLKPKEVVLKPEWAEGINRLAKMAKSKDNPITTNSTVIEVKGDLVKIDATIKDKTDAEYLTRRIEKTLKDKFNIKK